MKITYLAFTKYRGGAAKAAMRIYNALKTTGLQLDFIAVENKDTELKGIMNRIRKTISFLLLVLSHLLSKMQNTKISTKHSLNIFGNLSIKAQIKAAPFLHVHWINNETIRIKDFNLLSNKSVITLHDEWFYCGAEHYALDDKSFQRVIEGYTKDNRNVGVLDLNRFVWNLKRKYLRQMTGVIFTVPSSWMKQRASKSFLLKDQDIRIVPNPIDTNVFKTCSDLNIPFLKLDQEDFIITFGAVNGSVSDIKGFDLLESALQIFVNKVENLDKVKIIVFGGRDVKKSNLYGIEVFEVGHIKSESELSQIYSLSTITIVPSRAESFGQVAAESLSCETPVVAFDYSGVKDIVIHKKTGFLAKPFESDSLADGILWLYNMDANELKSMGSDGRTFIKSNFSNDYVANEMISIYREFEDNIK